MALIDVIVPDLGNFNDVPVVDVLVAVGADVEVETPLVTLETDKASIDVPSSAAGRVAEILVAPGAKVSKGSVILRLEASAAAPPAEAAASTAAPSAAADARQPEPPSIAAEADVRRQPGPPPAGAAAAATSPAPGAAASPPATSRSGAAPASAPRPSIPVDRQAQLLVLGAGPGGYTAAFRAADLGLSVVLVERWPNLGGVCLNVGCIPSKALLHAAKVIEEAESMAAHGIVFGPPQIDLDKLRGWKDGVVRKLTNGLRMLARQRKVEVVQGAGRFVAPDVVEVAGESGTQRIGFEQCIVAAGSESVRLPFLPDDPRVIDSTGALELESLPKRLLVIGGGIIGLEMACVYDALGVEV
ncbi:MAG: FAD-dependent oxidoreductase, partial [Gammaproteobacteria bacterium]|nr:FAD-dependent oxidoreductase [Gammaproteobacteria bacterium]